MADPQSERIRQSQFYRSAEFVLPCTYSLYDAPRINEYLDLLRDRDWESTRELEDKLERREAGDAVRVELASRYWTGLDAYVDPEYAIEVLLGVCATPANDRHSGARFRQTQARARAMLAGMLVGTLGDPSSVVTSDDAARRGAVAHTLYAAARYANEAAALGLPARVVLQVALFVEGMQLRLPEDRGAELAELRFEDLEGLWRVRDVLATSPMLSWAPHHSGDRPARPAGTRVCAARGCGIEETLALPFVLECGGPCPPDRKPAWCCRACAWSGWAAHQDLCTPKVQGIKKVVIAASSAERAKTAMRAAIEMRDTDLENVQRFLSVIQRTRGVKTVDDLGELTANIVREYHERACSTHEEQEEGFGWRASNQLEDIGEDSGEETETEESVRARSLGKI